MSKNLEEKFKKSEFFYLLVYRFVGGIPFVLSNVLPCIFNVKVTNFFLATFLGILPQLFLVVSIGSGLEEIIEKQIDDLIIIVKSGILEKKSKLRNFFEKERNTIAIAFYEDGYRELNSIIQKHYECHILIYP